MNELSHTFPCDYLVKIVGVTHSDFPSEVLKIIETETTLRTHILTESKNKRYLSLSVTLHLENELELETIYKQIKDKPYIKMIL
tara:strand:+ start:111 stop:362 length:252 start_codon:yes stop_codon:yes gene_type:complete